MPGTRQLTRKSRGTRLTRPRTPMVVERSMTLKNVDSEPLTDRVGAHADLLSSGACMMIFNEASFHVSR